MSLRRYPEYKDSGVAWLGKVPSHWDLRRLGFYVSERREKVSDAEFQPLSVTKNGVVPQLETAAKTDDGDNRKLVRAGDFVINSRSDRKGSSGLADLDGSVSLISTVLQLHDGANGQFVHHLLRSVPFQDEFYRFGKGIVADLWSTNYSEMSNILVAMPPLPEQRAIAAFLDRETAKIDALVDEQRRLMDLLREKRHAVISRAVTEGLNPDAPMKDSGVEWLGQVPAHWAVQPLKRSFSSVDYGISESLDAEGPVAVLRMGNIVDGRISMDDLKYVAAVEEGLLVEPGDLLYNRTNSLDLIGKVGLVTEVSTGPVTFASYLVRLRTVSSSDSRFLAYLLNTGAVLGLARSNAFVAIGQCNLNPTRYGMITVALPPKAEQVAIAVYLDGATARLEELRLRTAQAIALLEERRAALISAAVTGQIDVRDQAVREAA